MSRNIRTLRCLNPRDLFSCLLSRCFTVFLSKLMLQSDSFMLSCNDCFVVTCLLLKLPRVGLWVACGHTWRMTITVEIRLRHAWSAVTGCYTVTALLHCSELLLDFALIDRFPRRARFIPHVAPHRLSLHNEGGHAGGYRQRRVHWARWVFWQHVWNKVNGYVWDISRRFINTMTCMHILRGGLAPS